jgi:transposase-like protein
VELARDRGKPIAQIAKHLGVSESCPRRWMHLADVEVGRKEGLTSAERKALVGLRRQNRTLALENEILKRAAAYFAPITQGNPNQHRRGP